MVPPSLRVVPIPIQIRKTAAYSTYKLLTFTFSTGLRPVQDHRVLR
jgi:hypothetical protein